MCAGFGDGGIAAEMTPIGKRDRCAELRGGFR